MNGIAAPSGYGVAYDLFSSTHELLVSVDCSGTAPLLTVGSNQSDQYVYNEGYLCSNGWQSITLTSSVPLVSNAWYPAAASAALTGTNAGAWTYLVRYVCTWNGSAWLCGCADTTCATNYWQLQAFEEPSSSSVGSASGTDGPAPTSCATYASAGPIMASADDQVIQNLTITAGSEPGIEVNRHTGVIIQNVTIHQNGGPGIDVTNAPSTTIKNVYIVDDAAPSSGADSNSNQNNIQCSGSLNLTVTSAKLVDGSSGIYLANCDDSKLSFIEGQNFRGPFPRGQLVQWNNSNNGSLTDFSAQNDINIAWTEDNVNVFQSIGTMIERGLVDGNNSPSGDGVIADAGSSNMTVEDVDAIHQSNGCFAAYGGPSHDVWFIDTRCRDNYCSLPRGTPSSNSLAWAIDPQVGADINIEQSVYCNLCNPSNVVWDASKLAIDDMTEQDFTPRAPILVQLCQ